VVAGDDPDFVITVFPHEVQRLYPDMGITEPLTAVDDHGDLDREPLLAAAQSALRPPITLAAAILARADLSIRPSPGQIASVDSRAGRSYPGKGSRRQGSLTTGVHVTR
jgi:hypothetical protein